MPKLGRRIVAFALIVSTIFCSVTMLTFFSSADSQEMTTLLNESFDYSTDLTKGVVELGRNFELAVAGKQADNTTNAVVGDDHHNFNNDKFNIGRFGAIRYKYVLDDSYELSYKFKQTTNQAGRVTGLALILGNNLGDSISTTFEAYPNSGATLGASGLTLYLWDSSALIYTRRYISGESRWDYDAVCSNVSIGTNIESTEATIKVIYTKGVDSATYEFYCNTKKFATVTCSNIQNITVPTGTFASYTTITGKDENNSATITKGDAVVAVNGTFAYASRPINDNNLATLDDLVLKTSSNSIPSQYSQSAIFTEDFNYTSDNLQSELAKNFFVSFSTLDGSTSFTNSGLTISNDALRFSGFSAIKYQKALPGASTLSFDYSYDVSSEDSSAYGKNSGAAIIYSNSLSEDAFTLYEEYSGVLGRTGLVLYLWNNYLSIYVHKVNGGVISDSALISNANLVVSVNNSTQHITIDNDGLGNIIIYCNTIRVAEIKLSGSKTLTVDGYSFNGYETATPIYSRNGSLGATITDPLIARGDATFAFARRNKSSLSQRINVSNLTLEASSTDNLLANNGDGYVVGISASIDETIGQKMFVTLQDHPEADKLELIKINSDASEEVIGLFKLKDSANISGEIKAQAQTIMNKARGYELIYSIDSNVYPKEISDKYYIKGYLGANKIFESKQYSVKEYCEAIISAGDSSFSPETVSLCKAILNYGAEAQDYLDYETKGANQNISAVDQASSAITNYDSYKPRKEGNFTNVTFTGFNLTLKSIISLKLYFQVNNGAISDYTFKVDGVVRTPVEVQQDGGSKAFYCIEIAGISPDQYDHMYEITFDGVTVWCSVYSYAYELMKTTDVKYDSTKSLMGYMREYSDAVKEYVGDFSKTNNYISMKSETNVSAEIPIEKTSDKQVGLFYFILHGTGNSTANYDNSKVLANLRQAGLVNSDGVTLAEWQAAGGGNEKYNSFWGESMFGYYDSLDEWVVDKHVQMFIQANLDYIIVDTSNGLQGGTAYLNRIKLLFATLQKYAEQGFKVPKVAFMCYDDGTDTVDALYANIYVAHPEWNNLFYHWNNHQKPVIFDNIASYNKAATGQINTSTKLSSYASGVTDYFEIRDVAFPHETKNSSSNVWNGQSLIYLDFRATSDKFIDSADNNYSFMSVSVSEINATNHSSYNIFSETSDRSRNFDGTRNLEWLNPGDTGYIADVYKYGVNFAREFNNAITKNPDNIFITGWNEWEAYLQINNDSISFIDCADINNSRDIEPMTGGYGDNYYLQMCYFIQQFKYGTATGSSESSNTYTKTIDLNGNFSQWYDTNISTYLDAKGDSNARNHKSAQDSSVIYTENATPNDFTVMKVTSDANNFYFYARTSAGLDLSSDIVLLISTAGTTDYDYKVVISSGSTTLYTIAGSEVCTISRKISGAHLMLSIPRSSIGMTASRKIGFKWTAGIDITNSDEFYTVGDCAPYGRFSFIYS